MGKVGRVQKRDTGREKRREQSRVGAKQGGSKEEGVQGGVKKVKFSKKHLRETISSSLKIKIPVVRNESSEKKVGTLREGH